MHAHVMMAGSCQARWLAKRGNQEKTLITNMLLVVFKIFSMVGRGCWAGSESVKNGKFLMKIFFQIILNHALKIYKTTTAWCCADV